MAVLWEEIDSLTIYPIIAEHNGDTATYTKIIKQMMDEQHLYQFLMHLDEDYAGVRSNLLMRSPLPTLQEAVSMLQQEEAQRKAASGVTKDEGELVAL